MSPMKIDNEAIRSLAELLDETGLTEIEIAEGDMSIRVTRGGSVQSVVAPAAAAPVPAANAQTPAAGDGEDEFAAHPGAVISPMVGTAYLQSEPGAPSFVKAGDNVSEGDTLLIIEAMKVMNPIKAHKSGTVSRIFANDAQPVEFGELLMVIE